MSVIGLIGTYPSILMFVSKTDTTISWSNVTSFMTSLMAALNSEKSPMMAKVSRLSTSVREKLETSRNLKKIFYIKYFFYVLFHFLDS